MANSQTFTLNIKAVADMKDVQTNISNIQKALNQLKLPAETQSSFKKTFGELEKELDKYQKIMAGGFKTKGDANALEKSGNNIIRLYDKIVETMNSIDNSTLKKAFEDMGSKEVENLRKELSGLEADLKTKLSNQKIIDVSKTKTDLKNLTSQFKNAKGEIDATFKTMSGSTINTFFKNIDLGRLDLAEANLQKIEEKAAALKNQDLTTWVKNLRTSFDALKDSEGVKELGEDIDALKQKMSTIKIDIVKNLIDQFNKGKISAEDLAKAIQEVEQSDVELGKAQSQTNKELDQIKSRIEYFFGLNNAINLVKRAIRGAFDTIKELDKAMTETAVVTDFSVGDMWEQLPEYTKRANELGVSTLAAYQAATLYYQQGLKTEEVNALSVETLKMARIAGLEAAEATDRMTNALRGFNMALTEVNSQRVDDVYSELAANTASNVDEISTAMTKVASLAHNANMEFETTAAFLAQIIETTRESAETAGTALKTVVARFSEVKKLISEGELTGQDEEGQVIDVNRVGQALRTAGIDLNKYFLGEVGLDDIFMELASKWDSLTSVQQRYIATQAAGSRQQSRFIALMSDYARTQELVGKAYNAEGAAAKQFEKTQESLESKLARLKNAWNEFLMGLTNNELIKGFVDLLTDLINLINNLTSSLGEGMGTIAKWGTLIGGLSIGKAIFRSAGFDSILSLFTGKKSDGEAVQGFVKTISGAFSKAGKKIWADSQKLGHKIAESETGTMLGLNDYAGESLLKPIQAGLTGILSKLVKIAAIIAVIVVTAKALKYLYDNFTMAGQIKQSEQETERLRKASEQTADAVSDLSKRYDSLQNAQSTLNNLTKYTLEWKQALADSNQQIKDLIKTYPELANFVNYGNDNGNLVLSIDEDAVQDAIDKATKGSQLLNTAALLNDVSTAKLRIEAYNNVKETSNRSASLVETSREQEQSANQAQTFIGRLFYNLLRIQTDKAISDRSTGAIVNDVVGNGVDLNTATAAAFGELTPDDIAQNEALLKNAYAQAARSAIIETASENIIVKEYGEAFSKAFAYSYNSDQYKTAMQTALSALEDQTNLELQYSYIQQFGIAPSDEIAHDDKALREQIASAQAVAAIQEQVDLNFQTVVQNGWGEIANLINGEVTTDLDKVNEIIDNLNGDSIIQLSDAFGLTDEKIKELTKDTDYAGTGLKGYLRWLTKVNNESKKQTKKNALLNAKQAGLDSSKIDALYNNDNITIQWYQQLDKFAETFSQYGQQFSSILINSVSDAMAAGDWENSALAEFANNISDNPILTLKAIRDEAANASSEVQALAIELQKIVTGENKPRDFSITAQVQYYFASDEFSGLQETIKDLSKETGKISAEGIKKLAESSKTLNALLEENEVNARGLAVAVNAIESGTATFMDLNEKIVTCTGSFITLNELMQEAKEWRTNFPEFDDYGEALEFIESKYKEFLGMVEDYEVGNPALVQGIQEFLKFGNTAPESQKEWASFLDMFNKFFVEGQGQNFWSDIMGWTESPDGYFNSENLKDIQGYSDLMKQVQEMWYEDLENNPYGTEMSEGFAKQLIQNMLNHDEGQKVAKELGQRELTNFLKSYYEGMSEPDVLPTQAQIALIAEKWGISPEDLWNAFKAQYEDGDERKTLDFSDLDVDIKLPDKDWWIDKLGNAGNQITNTSDILKYLGTNPETGAFDVDTIYVNIRELVPQLSDASDEKITEYIDQMIAEATKDGETVELPVTITTTVKTTGENGKDTYFQDISSSAETAVTSVKQLRDVTKQVQKNTDETVFFDSLDTPLKNANDLADSIKLTLSELVATIDTKDATEKIKTLNSQIDSMVAERKLKVNPELTESTITLSAGEGGSVTVKLSLSAFTGGLVKSYAKGSEGFSIKPGVALTGELGPEIVWNGEKGYAYIAGQNGPEFNDLKPGDRIFNANETKDILKNSGSAKYGAMSRGGKVNSYGITFKPDSPSNGGGGGGRSGSGSGKDKDNDWRNELDWLYNVMENIAELERQQTQLQEKYEDLLEDETKTGYDLYKLLIERLGNLQAQLDHQTYALERREQEMAEFMDVTNDQDKYLWYNWEDRTLEIDWDAINAITDQEKYDHIVDLINQAEEIQGKMDDAEDAIIDIENQIQDLENVWRENFTKFEERVLNAIVKMYQSVIDNYSELNDTLNETNTNILDAINKEISLQRQIRDNTKTEQEIADSEAQLAYLQRDTTGGNDLAALQLSKELDDQRQSYEDNLIDQAIEKLQEDNDAAAQQREKQIEIMQAQLDYQSANGEFNAYIRQLMESAIDPEGHLATDSELFKLLASQENRDAMTETQKAIWDDELTTTFSQVVAQLLLEQGERDGTYYTAVTEAFNGLASVFEKAFHGSTSQGSANGHTSTPSTSTPPESTHHHNYVTKQFKKPNGDITIWEECSCGKTRNRRTIRGQAEYATGGLNTQTGPAWLDGTPSEPEYVLNARQTDAFLKLADVLPAAMNPVDHNISNVFGATTNNIVINVDKIDSDYSVDQMVDRVKEKLFESGSYRNNNVLSLMR